MLLSASSADDARDEGQQPKCTNWDSATTGPTFLESVLNSNNGGRRTAGILSKGYVLMYVSTLCLVIGVRGPDDG